MGYRSVLVLWGVSAALMGQGPASSRPDATAPVARFSVDVVAKTAKAINYRHRSGATKIEFKGTANLPMGKGEAKVESKQGYIEIEVEFRNLQAAAIHGAEYLTYVLWAVTPEGRATNLGEILLNGSNAKLNVTTELQAFGLIVTAEPYFAVTQPSDVVVMENVIRPDTAGKVDEIDAKFELLQRGRYATIAGPAPVIDAKVPLELYEARSALHIARATGAEKYAAETVRKSADLLAQAEGYQSRKAGKKPVSMLAREAVQTAEDARVLTIKRKEEEGLENERQASAAREAEARAQAEQQALRARESADRARLESERRALAEKARAEAEADRAAAEKAKREAEEAAAVARKLTAEANLAREAAERAKAEAEAARAAAMAEVETARQSVAIANRMRQRAEDEKIALRKQLLDQFNLILETRDSARGLIVNLADVLFDFGKYSLRPETREKLSKISGIVLAHPGLRLDVEGHTDSVGSDDLNQKLSENRAAAVREYLIEQGLRGDAVTARGFGKAQPAVPNDSAANRQRNRRVEMIISGEIIGTQLNTPVEPVPPTPNPPQN